jgi:Protein of unknown function (DUF2938)
MLFYSFFVFLTASLFIGIGATALFDLWGLIRAKLAGTPAPDWRLAGRWFSHALRGHVFHNDIAAAAPVPHEQLKGWLGHYAIGVLYALVLLTFWGMGWAAAPTVGPALTVGIVTIAAGWFLMSPGMGNGWAASRSATPWRDRARGLVAHVVFGLGLYLSALIWAALTG